MRTIICLALACGMILCMGAQPMQFEAFSEDGGGAVYVSDGVYLRTECGHRVICVHGVPTIHYELGDRAAEAHAMVSCLNPDMRLKRRSHERSDIRRAVCIVTKRALSLAGWRG